MSKIKIKTNINEQNHTEYYTSFEIYDEMPSIEGYICKEVKPYDYNVHNASSYNYFVLENEEETLYIAVQKRYVRVENEDGEEIEYKEFLTDEEMEKFKTEMQQKYRNQDVEIYSEEIYE